MWAAVAVYISCRNGGAEFGPLTTAAHSGAHFSQTIRNITTWGGSASDQHIMITQESGFLDLLEPTDLIMAGRGFTTKEDLTDKRS